jgi:hypothetical protein
VTHGRQASRDVIDAFYTTWDWKTLCAAVMTLPVSNKTQLSTEPFQDFFTAPQMLGFEGENGGVDGTRKGSDDDQRAEASEKNLTISVIDSSPSGNASNDASSDCHTVTTDLISARLDAMQRSWATFGDSEKLLHLARSLACALGAKPRGSKL